MGPAFLFFRRNLQVLQMYAGFLQRRDAIPWTFRPAGVDSGVCSARKKTTFKIQVVGILENRSRIIQHK